MEGIFTMRQSSLWLHWGKEPSHLLCFLATVAPPRLFINVTVFFASLLKSVSLPPFIAILSACRAVPFKFSAGQQTSPTSSTQIHFVTLL